MAALSTLGLLLPGIVYFPKNTIHSRTVTKKCLKKCNSPAIFSVLVVFLGCFFSKNWKKAQQTENVTIRE